MNKSSKLFSGRAYVFEKNKKVPEKEGGTFQFVNSVLSKSKVKLIPEEISSCGGDENYDEYCVESEGLLYSLKISLDNNCPTINSEIKFLKENQSQIIPIYYDSGIVKIGTEISFLISSYEKGFSIKDFGIKSILDNSDSFFYSLHRFNELKTEKTIDDYISSALNNFSIKNGSEFLRELISSVYNIDEIDDVFEILERSIKTCSDFQTSSEKTCHGSLTHDGIITKNGLYKFKDFGFVFKFDPLYDLAFLSLSLGYERPSSTLLFKKYCDFNGLDFLENKQRFDNCMKLASCVYLLRVFFEFLIEEGVFTTSRPEKLVDSSLKFTSSNNAFKNVPNFSIIGAKIERIITRPLNRR